MQKVCHPTFIFPINSSLHQLMNSFSISAHRIRSLRPAKQSTMRPPTHTQLALLVFTLVFALLSVTQAAPLPRSAYHRRSHHHPTEFSPAHVEMVHRYIAAGAAAAAKQASSHDMNSRSASSLWSARRDRHPKAVRGLKMTSAFLAAA